MRSEDRKLSSSSNASVRNPFRQFLSKCRVGLHRISKEVLDSDSVEECGTVNGLFDHEDRKKSRTEERRSEERNSSTSVTLNREMPLTDEEDNEIERDSNEDCCPSGSSGSDPQTFATYDAVEECVKLRSKLGEPFVQAEQIWQKRRELWCKPTGEAEQLTAVENRDRFEEIAPRHYVRVYRKLVVEGVPLKRAINLQDAIKVINAGWVETQKWDRAAKGLA
ncbi:LAME_0E07426g1_1 [Lachancea meyersii CBS 8951]|uniref:LAME_0E07426g1_1 n=1 Tax=Lachancea meyersii CBS 8951 TaxID=1266667 RepID=A0A1G4JIN9_9SACH|nr:LAME_0E07426g1_1 [Lachancea meyersii CBS 8951]